MVDERSFIFCGAFGSTRNPPPNLYVKTFEDEDGATLDGSNTYRLTVPPNVPTKQFWSVAVYDNATAGFIREAPVVGLDSYDPKLRSNPYGSVDLYLAPKPPPGHETNWIFDGHRQGVFPTFAITHLTSPYWLGLLLGS